MRECEGIGKNIEQAINNALLELKAAREDVDIKILSEGGFLKKARVLVSISADAVEKYEKKADLRRALSEEKENDEDFAENFLKRKNAKTENEQTAKAQEPEEKAKPKVRIVADEEYVKPEKKAAKNKAEATEEERPERAEEQRKYTGEEFLQGVLKTLNLEGEINKTEDEKFVRYSLSGENLNDLIGHHGDCMLSLSHLMNLVCKNDDKKRFVLDVENYRAKREESLVALAKRIANKVAKSGRYYKFEPMDASERKVIHTALQEDDRVTTLSKGEEPRRYLIVFPKEYHDR